MSQQQLVQELCIDKSNVARLCAKLVQEGQAKQRTGAEDGRSRVVALTSKGIKLAQELEVSSRRRFAALLSGFPRGGVEVIHALRQLTDSVELTLNHGEQTE